MNFLERPKDKFELRDYLKKFELDNPEKLEAMAEEIVGNIFEIMDKYRQLAPNHPLRKYYEPSLKDIEFSYSSADFKKIFPLAIKCLINSIDWE